MSVDKTINFTERSAQADTPATGDWRLYFKSGGLYALDDTGTETLLGSGSGANTALSNLAAVAINTSLISDTDSTDDLGSTSVYWRNAYLDTVYLSEQAAPSTPAAGKVVLYPKSDGLLYSKDDAGTETLVSGGSGGGAPTDATYITQTANGSLSNEQALSALATGIVKNTTTTGVLSIAVANTDYAAATHASRHESGGADEINGGALETTFNPTNYTESGATLDGHLAGIDTALGAVGGGTSPQIIINGFNLKWLANDKVLVSGGTVAHGTTLINKTTGTVLTMGTGSDWIDGASGEAASAFASVYINSSGALKLHDTLPANSSPTAATYVANMRVNQVGWNGTAASGLNATSVVYDTDTGEGSIAAGMLLGVYSDSAYTLGRGKGSAATATLNNMSFALITAVNTGTNTLTLEAGHQIAINDNDYMIVIENAPVVYRDEGGTVWRWIGAMFNNASSNLESNRTNKRASYTANEGANYTQSGTSFADIDSTSWAHTLILTEVQDVACDFRGSCTVAAGANVYWNVLTDGALLGADDGLYHENISTAAGAPKSPSFNVTDFARLPGTHQYKVQWKVGASTVTLYAGAGTAALDLHPEFSARIAA